MPSERSGTPLAGPALAALVRSTGIAPTGALAQSATPGAVLDEVVVSASRDPLVVRLDAAAGGTAIITPREMPASTNLTLSRALADVSGVVVQDFFGGNDQPRVQIRGSGLQQNPVERGILMLRNGLPLNRADGSYVVGFADLGAADAIEVFGGHMANRLGATVRGGAFNLISPTGRSAPGVALAAGGGSFDQLSGNAQYGYAHERVDLLLQGGYTEREGFRDYNASRCENFGGNLGLRLSDTLTVRLFAGHVDLGFDVPSPLTRDLLDHDTRAVFAGPTVTPGGAINLGPNVVRDRPRRDASQFRAGARDEHVGRACRRLCDRSRAPGYGGHRPEATLLYQLVQQHYPAFRALRAEAGRPLPEFVQEEFEAYLRCGRLEEGFLRVRCEHCHAEKLVAFSCKRRGFCPSCSARRMAETAALLADELLPERPFRQWVLSLPHALRFLLARDPDALTWVLGVVYRTISRHLIEQAGLTRTTGAVGAVTLIQRFGSALNLNVHFHMLFLEGVFLAEGADPPAFRHVAAPDANDLQELVEQIAARVGQVLERRGLIERDIENAWLAAVAEPGPLDDLIGHSICAFHAIVNTFPQTPLKCSRSRGSVFTLSWIGCSPSRGNPVHDRVEHALPLGARAPPAQSRLI